MAMGIDLALVDGPRRQRDGPLSLSQVRGQEPDPSTNRTGRDAHEVLPRRRRGMEACHREDTRVATAPVWFQSKRLRFKPASVIVVA